MSWLLVVVMLVDAPLASALDLSGGRDVQPPPGMTSEFIYRTDSEDALIPVYLIGAVARPGLYHIPSTMDLVSLLTLAGGPLSGARVDEILVKGQQQPAGSPKRLLKFDLEDAVSNDSVPRLGLVSNDLVYVTPGKAPITTDILTVLGVVTGILGIVATSIVISQNLGK